LGSVRKANRPATRASEIFSRRRSNVSHASLRVRGYQSWETGARLRRKAARCIGRRSELAVRVGVFPSSYACLSGGGVFGTEGVSYPVVASKQASRAGAVDTRLRTCDSYLVDPASSHMLVSKTKPCMSKYRPLTNR
jgi:hypothetical protein